LTTEIRVPAGAVYYSVRHRVQTGSEAHPTSSPMDTGSYFPGGKVAVPSWWPISFF